ncbi:hypothetical protein [Streptomyces collinus]|uniref:hypothetical protein n=1 Tax=Streptomyces collinus TaxID=42684 RepID=UPI0033CED5B4
MSVDQLPRQAKEFANYLDGFLERLRQDGGWCGIFWRRDPEGMRACLDGLEVPPWDVMEALLQDLAAAYGPAAAAAERERALTLHTAAVAAFDALPGARDALGDRLDAMLRAQRYAVERQAELALLLAAAATREEADALRVDIAWAHDDHDRASARCTALRARLTALDRQAAPEDDGRPTGAAPPGTTGGHPAPSHPRLTGTPRPPDRPAGRGGATAAPATGPTPGPEGWGPPISGSHEPWAPGAERAPRLTDRRPTPPDASAPAAVFAPGPAGSGAPASGVPGSADPGTGRPLRFTGRSRGSASVPGAATSDAPAAPGAVHASDPSASGLEGPMASGGAQGSWFTEQDGAPVSRPGPSGVERSMASGAAQASWFTEQTGAPVPRPESPGIEGPTTSGGAQASWSAEQTGAPAPRSESPGVQGPMASGGAQASWSAEQTGAAPAPRREPPGVPGATVSGGAQASWSTEQTGAPVPRPESPGVQGPMASGGAQASWSAEQSGAAPAPRREPPGVPGATVSGGAQASWSAEQTGAAPAPRREPSRVSRAPAAGADAGRRLPPPAGDGSSAPGGKARKRRRGSARFAGMVEDEGGAVVVPQVAGGAPGRGARFAGAGEQVETGAAAREPAPEADPAAQAAVAATVRALVRLRAEGRSGEAHALLVECAHWPTARLPLLADALEPAGLGADWGTLLWEAASLPAEPLVAAAEALTAAGRPADGRQLLRQGVVRPAAEIGAAVLQLDTQGRGREVLALLDAYVRVRPPEEAARSAAADPRRLVPLLLRAARGVSEEREWDLLHALRVAGLA